MEVAVGIYGLLSAGATAAGTAVTTAATAVGSAAAGASSALSVISGVATAGSVLASLAGGVMANQEAKMQASATELQTREKALRIKEEELQKIGAARVAFAGSGVSLASAGAVEDDLSQEANFETSLTRSSGDITARQIRLRGSSGLIAAAGDALGTTANYAIDLRRRG